MKQNKLISIFCPTLYAGGAERSAVQLANALANQQKNVHFVVIDSSGPLVSELSNQVKLFDLKKTRLLKSFFAFYCYLKKEKPSTVFSLMTHTNIIAILAGKMANKKIQIIPSERTDFASLKTKKVNFLVTQFLAKRLYKKINTIHAVSSGVAKSINLIFNVSQKKIKVLPNFVNIEEIKTLSNNTSNKIDQNKSPYLVAIGRLEKEKEFSTLINAFKIIIQKINIRLLIIGEGSLRYELKSQINKNNLNNYIFLIGYKQNPFAILAQAKCFVLTSSREGFPNVLLQAMALGVPCVATDCQSGPREILQNGKFGILVPVGDYKKIAIAVLRILKSKKTYNAEKRALFYDIKKILPHYNRLLGNEK